MSILLVCLVVSGAKFSLRKYLSTFLEWVFSPATGPPESKDRLENHWLYREKYTPELLNALSMEGPVTSKNVKRRPLIHTKEVRSAHSS